jgi:ABC-2 type transport system ATP-binding protein
MAIIECSNLRKQYGKVNALRGVNFTIEANSCLGFLGPNGAGKTTAIRILAGLARPSGGEVRVAGIDVVNNPSDVRAKIGYLAQTPVFYNWMSGEEYLLFCAELFKLHGREARIRAGELLETTGLKQAGKRKIGGYSGGMKQRLGIAQSLINSPEVLFLDEPVSALDPIGRHQVLEIIRQLKAKTTVFFSTHVLNDASQICDEVVILKDGEVAIQSGIAELHNKHATQVFEVELEQISEGFLNSVKAQVWYTSHAVNGKLLTVVVNDVEQTKIELPKVIINQGAVMTKYQLQTPTLEEVFLKVVKANARDVKEGN